MEEESTHIKALAVAAMRPPDMLRADGAGETSMLPGMVEMIVSIVPARVMPDPAIVLSVHVRRFGMSRRVLVGPPLFALLPAELDGRSYFLRRPLRSASIMAAMRFSRVSGLFAPSISRTYSF
jgi:hypothetical protein